MRNRYVSASACAVVAFGAPAHADLTAAEAAAAFVSAFASAGYEVNPRSTAQDGGTLTLRSVRIGRADEPFATAVEPAWIRFSERPNGSVLVSVPESMPIAGRGYSGRISTSGLEPVLRHESGTWEVDLKADWIAADTSGNDQNFESDIRDLEFRMTFPDANSSAPVTSSGSFARFGVNGSDQVSGTVSRMLIEGADWDAAAQLAGEGGLGEETLRAMDLAVEFGPLTARESFDSRDLLRYSSKGGGFSLQMDAPWEVSATWDEKEQAIGVAELGGVTIASSKYSLDVRPARNGSLLVSTVKTDVDGVLLDEATRSVSAVAGRLPREPAALRSDVSLTIPAELMQSESQPTRRKGVHDFHIREIVVNWAGASLTASGEIRVSVDYASDEYPETPEVNLDIRADSMLSLLNMLNMLSSAGVLSREEAVVAIAVLSTYGQRVPGESDSLRFRFEAGPGSPPLLNGRPLPN